MNPHHLTYESSLLTTTIEFQHILYVNKRITLTYLVFSVCSFVVMHVTLRAQIKQLFNRNLIMLIVFTPTFPRQNSGLMVLRYLVGLLGRNAHIIFNIVSQMGVPQRILFLLLKESGMYQMNVLEVSHKCHLKLRHFSFPQNYLSSASNC